MSTLVDVLHPGLQPEVVETPAQQAAPTVPARAAWSRERFADEQIRMLVRRVFFPGWPKPARHVVFSAVDEGTYVAEICMEVGKALSAQVAGSVCVVEANPHNPELESVFWRSDRHPAGGYELGSPRDCSQHVSGNLWLAPLRALLGDSGGIVSLASLKHRLSDFHLEFDYTVLHAPPAGHYGESALLGHLSDGVALVLEANSTRRVAAQKTKEMLQAANARVLGTILSERTFPIPQGIYRRL
jgi:succinoglycan biosynthesis transport protein ExoP